MYRIWSIYMARKRIHLEPISRGHKGLGVILAKDLAIKQ